MSPGLNVLRNLWSGADVYRIRIAGLALCIFVLDTITVNDVVIPVLYVNVVLLAMRSGRADDVVAAGLGSIGLTVVSFLFTTKSGQFLTIAVFNGALGVLAIVCVMLLCLRNIRSQTEVLRARDRMALVSRRISLRTMSESVVHEVTQPLTAIGANAEAARRWLSQTPPDLEETRTAADRIVAEVTRASEVITRLRGLTALGAVSPQTCDIGALIGAALAHLRMELSEANVDVALTCPANLMADVDRVLIEQVVINCLSNSLAAMRAIDIDKRLITIVAARQRGMLLISLGDSGVGADAATIEQMFDPFFTMKVGEGMGVGLAVCKSIVEAHGGSIRAYPNKSRGLVIEFEVALETTSRR